MALMLAKTYAAFKAAGVGEAEAQAAAEELAAFEGRFASIDTNILQMNGTMANVEGKIINIEGKTVGIEGKITGIESKVVGIEAKFTVLLWAVGINAAATIAILGVLLRH